MVIFKTYAKQVSISIKKRVSKFVIFKVQCDEKKATRGPLEIENVHNSHTHTHTHKSHIGNKDNLIILNNMQRTYRKRGRGKGVVFQSDFRITEPH